MEKEKTKTKRYAVIYGCTALFLIAAMIVLLNAPKTSEGGKEFTLTVYSERDGINRTETYTSEYEYFGQWCREQDFITWEDSAYGIYITAVDGCSENMDEQYWWCITVDGESASTGADEIPLTDGGKYGFELKQGW